MEKIVYILQHTARIGKDEDVKTIGIYSTEQHAGSAVERVREKPSFREPDGEFNIGPYVLDQDYWADGFGIDF